MTNSIIQFLEKQAAEIVARYKQGVEYISGHNGPYKDVETGVRAQSHLIVLLTNLDKSKGENQYKALVEELVENLLGSKHRLDTIVFNQRTKPGKDEVNGVIGIAWIMEAMCCAYEYYRNEDARIFLSSAEQSLRFNKRRAVWYRPVLEDNKYYHTIDETFNHQLWLAYALVYKSTVLKEELSPEVLSFFKNLDTLMRVHNSGLVKHGLLNVSTVKLRTRHLLKSGRDKLIAILKRKSFTYKEYGYHLFNMYAFARIADLGHVKLFSHSLSFKKAKAFCLSSSLYKELTINKDDGDFYMRGNDSKMPFNRYGMPYNVSGFELIYVDDALQLGMEKDTLEKYYEAQLTCYGLTPSLELNGKEVITEDLPNLMLRSYELSFLTT